MLRPYGRRNERPFGTSDGMMSARSKIRRRIALMVVPLMVVFALISPRDMYEAIPQRGLRRLALKCVHNVYASTVKMALDMPRPPTVTHNVEVPSYIAICNEWIRRGAQGTTEPIHTVEDDTPCLDWTSPHYRLLEIFSSSMLDRVNGFSRYRHDCYRSRQWDEAVTGMDRTTVQQMLPVARLDPNEELVTADQMKQQCKVCLMQFHSSKEATRVKSFATHHCFGWPESWTGHDYTVSTTPGTRGDVVTLPESPAVPNVVPLSAIATPVRSRLGYVAKIFSNITDAPPDEHRSGVVIYLDPTSYGIAKEIYPNYFPASVTSITVLTSPLCATAYLRSGQKCSTYAEELVDYFKLQYNQLTNTGYKGLSGIKFQMAASTAGAFSRMILAKKLICPPHSMTCLFPAMAKLVDPEANFDTSATILESSDWGAAIDFFTVVGHENRVVVERLPDTDIPAIVPKPTSLEQLYTTTNEKVAPEFNLVNWDLDDEGFLPGQNPAAPMSRSDAALMSDADVLAATSDVPSNRGNPNVYTPVVEEVPDEAYAQSRAAIKKPINLNYGIPNSDIRATDEMGVDTELGFSVRAMTPELHAAQIAERSASQQRITGNAQIAKAKQLAEATNGNFPPSMEMEVYCPEVTDEGYPVTIQGGTAYTDGNSQVTVSDGAGTGVFDRDSLTEETVAITRDPDSRQQPFTHIYDPHTKQNITITGTNVTLNRAQGQVKSDPVGVLLVDNITDPYAATLITEGGSGNARVGDTQKVYKGTIISTGTANTKDGTVIRHDDGYAVKTDFEPGTQRTISYRWNKFYDGKEPAADKRDQDQTIIDGKQPKEIAAESPPARRALGVSIKVPTEDFKYGNPEDLQRICHKHKDKVLEASIALRRTREAKAAEQRMMGDTTKQA